MSDNEIHVRLAQADDDAFILSLVERFVEFDLPPWRNKRDCLNGIYRDIARHLSEQPAGSFLFVAENDDGELVGFLHLQKTLDFFTQHWNCHISDIAVPEGGDGKGIGRAMLAFTDSWAQQHDCRLITLSVFPGNSRARALYESCGFGADLIRMAKVTPAKHR